MKMKVHEPVCIAQGPTYEEVSWGPWQFPGLREDEHGNIYASIGISEDNESARENDSAWFISRDRGETWEQTTPENAAVGYTLMPNGDRLESFPSKLYQIPEEAYKDAEPLEVLHDWCDIYVYNKEDIKPGYIGDKFRFWRVKAGETERKIDYGTISGYDKQVVTRTINGFSDPYLFGRMRVAPDGSVWHTDYGRERNQVTGKYHPGFTALYFRSTDYGKSWKLESTIEPPPLDSPNYNYYCEPDIAWLDEKTAVTVNRGSFCSYAVSHDGGFTWDEPKYFDSIGVYPAIAALKCGAVLVSYGRPGFLLRASLDGKCETWEEPVELIGRYDHASEMNEPCAPGGGHSWGTCSYSDIVVLNDNEALVVYTDFFRPDEKGIKRKSLMVVKVSFEEE